MVLQIDVASVIGIIFLLIILLIILASSIKVTREYERAVVFRLGRLLGAKGPGVIFIIPIIDRTRIVDLRVVTLDIPKQRVITKDNVTCDVDAVVYFRVGDPLNAVVKVQDYILASSMIAQTTLRDVLGQVEFDDLLAKRDELNKKIQSIIDEFTDPWGIKVTAVAIKDITIPESMQRAIAKQAEAERERRGRIIMADGELQAARKMAEAAEYYVRNPSALRLRELQTWAEIAREKNLIVVTEGSSLGAMLGLMKNLQSKEKD
ncbi:Modulator of FtsH protease HflC [archaeon HR06]|nr:Modulator of FtsH protease HflC [archaeon HR06]